MAIMCSSFADMMGLVAIARHGIPNLGSCDRTITPAQQIYNRMDEKQQNQGVGVYGVQKYICTIHYVGGKKVLLIMLPNAKMVVMKSRLLNKAQQKQFHSSKGLFSQEKVSQEWMPVRRVPGD